MFLVHASQIHNVDTSHVFETDINHFQESGTLIIKWVVVYKLIPWHVKILHHIIGINYVSCLDELACFILCKELWMILISISNFKAGSLNFIFSSTIYLGAGWWQVVLLLSFTCWVIMLFLICPFSPADLLRIIVGNSCVIELSKNINT